VEGDEFRRHVESEHFPDSGSYSWEDLSERNEVREQDSLVRRARP
jgi:hypothetical protein